MGKYTGLWIDHRKAVIVTIEGETDHIQTIESHTEGHFRIKGGSRSSTPYGPQQTVSESQREERSLHHLHNYYQAIIHAIRDTEKILIFGPGEAKTELEKEIRKSKELSPRITAVESADKMTETQIKGKVRGYFIFA